MKLVKKNIQSTARNVLLAESEAIRQAMDCIDDQFEQIVETILQTSGRVVVTGIGKSAIIGQKIVATLNSTGTPSLFMHAADAIHGDLGMIQANDVVICISKSGNTPEIKVLVPLLKRTGAKLIALASQTSSYLCVQADFVLKAYAEQEADPLNLVPTTSTTVALALGDALAVSLLNARGFTSQDFARFHPGGSLGKKLYLKVSDIYPHHEIPTVPLNATVHEVIIEMTSKRLGATAVADENGQLAGIVTDGDLRRMLNRFDTLDLGHLRACDIMTPSPLSIDPDEYATHALKMMQDRSITQLIVAVDNQIKGFIHLHDLLKEGLV
ncbi:KpsF/GutQ family sugar-phosphate isomerase [Larkinella humicola]|uniref:KpsF/GutQ family sugar-phosphate isomerase n=1 Tax=Larkinella humicola TaxID=2607654 RepID=A0A5N1JCV5_9BACT|nr:KpsF/GutQ family sugar-phosphate isomerase [Larkinella humicola]KAA9352933.1 KpsF/GutQ family sugar-phosphate isomerase [Larkinella humicola]